MTATIVFLGLLCAVIQLIALAAGAGRRWLVKRRNAETVRRWRERL